MLCGKWRVRGVAQHILKCWQQWRFRRVLLCPPREMTRQVLSAVCLQPQKVSCKRLGAVEARRVDEAVLSWRKETKRIVGDHNGHRVAEHRTVWLFVDVCVVQRVVKRQNEQVLPVETKTIACPTLASRGTVKIVQTLARKINVHVF